VAKDEWEKAQKDWDDRKRAVGAIPALPQQNSTESFADSDVVAFLRTIGLLRENLSASVPTVDAENVLNNPDLSRYGYRNTSPSPKGGEKPEKVVPEGSFHAFTWTDLVAAVVGGLIAAPLCDASWHAIVGERETIRGLVGLSCGLPIGILGFTFHWWKDRLTWLKPMVEASIYWWPVVVVLVFAYVAGPEIYRRAILPQAPIVVAPALSPPSAKATNDAALRNLTAERDKALKDLSDAKHELEITKKAAIPAPLGTVTLVAGEIGALLLLNRFASTEVISKSANIKAAEIETGAYDLSNAAMAICTLSCVTVRIVFDGSYGPFDVSVQDTSSILSGGTLFAPKIAIGRAGDSFLDVVVDPGSGTALGTDLRELRVSIRKRTY
jgi:hypothetical protein